MAAHSNMALLLTMPLALASSLRVGLFIGNGCATPSRGNYSVALAALVADGSIASWIPLSDTDVAEISAASLDVVMFPGGSGSQEAAAIGVAGGIAVKAFVSSGGGYVVSVEAGYNPGLLVLEQAPLSLRPAQFLPIILCAYISRSFWTSPLPCNMMTAGVGLFSL